MQATVSVSRFKSSQICTPNYTVYCVAIVDVTLQYNLCLCQYLYRIHNNTYVKSSCFRRQEHQFEMFCSASMTSCPTLFLFCHHDKDGRSLQRAHTDINVLFFSPSGYMSSVPKCLCMNAPYKESFYTPSGSVSVQVKPSKDVPIRMHWCIC